MLMQEDMSDYFVLLLAVLSIFLFSVYCRHFPFPFSIRYFFSLTHGFCFCSLIYYKYTILLLVAPTSFGDLFLQRWGRKEGKKRDFSRAFWAARAARGTGCPAAPFVKAPPETRASCRCVSRSGSVATGQ